MKCPYLMEKYRICNLSDSHCCVPCLIFDVISLLNTATDALFNVCDDWHTGTTPICTKRKGYPCIYRDRCKVFSALKEIVAWDVSNNEGKYDSGILSVCSEPNSQKKARGKK